MSGGSYNYLHCKDPSEIRGALDDLQRMAERLTGLGYAPRAAAATERLLAVLRDDDPVSDAIADLADVWHAVEWTDSCDWSEDQLRAEVERYEARPQELANLDAVPTHLLEQLSAAWPNRKRVNLAHALYGAQVQGAPTEFPAIVEQGLAEQITHELRVQGRMLVTTTGPVWTRHRAEAGTHAELVTNPPAEPQPAEGPWQPGESASVYDVLTCRITGTSIPTLTQES
ncbi:hypothetical protein VA596_41560 [Amycolatopsis sp., V23-08]|uniref:DUF222 domain-containing protein n=1 Tax=Amycolatopsis heterodermiae TaxID=3110235 RepID=A0ABU5RK21_9PSEU|nr:hypothetical protein [Amycolatopsis sp., V23-08]MEA5366074.1 hypothetical protein [Amycolatopsis sp., V23-08]